MITEFAWGKIDFRYLTKNIPEDIGHALYPYFLRKSEYSADLNYQPYAHYHASHYHASHYHASHWFRWNPHVKYYTSVPAFINETKNHAIFTNVWFLFEQEQDRADFVKWLKQYQAWFDNGLPMSRCYFPTMPSSGTHSLSFVNFKSPDDDEWKRDTALFDLWNWVLCHCEKPVYVMNPSCFAFEDQKEAAMFKLHHA